MKSVEQILAELDTRVRKYKLLGNNGVLGASVLEELKEFITTPSAECDHVPERVWAGTLLTYCKKCGVEL